MDFDGFLKGEPFNNSNQSYSKIFTWALLASGQGVIKLIWSNQNGIKYRKQYETY